MSRHTVVLSFALLALAAPQAFAATEGIPAPNQLFGHITSNRTITASSPGPNYEIIGDLTIDPGVTVTIQDGVTLLATANSDYLASGLHPGRVEFTVNGALFHPGSGSVTFGSTRPEIPPSWTGIVVGPAGQLNLRVANVRDGDYGVYLSSGGAATLTDCVLSHVSTGIVGLSSSSASFTGGRIEDCGTGAFIEAGGALTITKAAVTVQGDGIDYQAGSLGDIRACVINCPSGGGQTGLRLSFSPTPADSVHPDPTRISGFGFGVDAVAHGISIDHMIISSCGYGIHDDLGPHTASYCTFVADGTTAWGLGRGAIYNSILLDCGGFYPPEVINYSDGWSEFGAYDWGGAQLGNAVSTFNPFFVPGDPLFHLQPASFYTNFSVSGGQIGAYGPGPVGPTPVLSASVVDSDGSEGYVRVRWFSETSGGSKASVLRRSEGGEWQPLTVLYPDGRGYITLEDRNVEPGMRYEYGVGVQRDGRVGVEGEVWVTVNTPVTGLAMTSIEPNPASTAWSVVFLSPASADTRIDVLDLSGRVVKSTGLGVVSPGRQTVSLPAQALRPGIYWIRLTQAGHSVLAKAIRTN